MFYSGISDEAAKDLDSQIRAHKELGWNHIEMRNVDGVQFHDLDDQAFDRAAEQLAAAGLRVSCFASAIANWARKITMPFEDDMAILRRAIPRMRRLGTPFIRVMSYPNDDLADDAWRDEAVRRLSEMARAAADAGVTLVLENCDGWASQSPAHFSRFVELVGSPALKVVYDLGNPAAKGYANSWDWYLAAKPHIAYIHVKACSALGKMSYPDEGAESRVAEVFADLFASGYDGGFSIEPHLAAVIHAGKTVEDAAGEAYRIYVEYGRRTVRMVEAARAAAGKG